jgi:hypothetical protein
MSEPIKHDERQWERGWDGHLAAQLRRVAKLPLAQKLEWLEEAQRLAEYIQRHRTQAATESGSLASSAVQPAPATSTE